MRFAAASPADEEPKARPDQVFVLRKSDGALTSIAGRIQKNDLDKVVVAASGKESTFDAELVQRVVWGDVPPAYHEAQLYVDRGEWPNAVAKWRIAAGDASARDVVRASAKLEATEALLRWGATEPERFAEAVVEVQGFLASYGTNREIARAKMLEARATWLAGKPAEAGALYRAIFASLQGDKAPAGFDRLTCLRAGLFAARALLDAKDTLAAREVFASLNAGVGPIVAGAKSDDPSQGALQDILDESILGDGFVELAAGNSKAALAFFQGKVTSLDAGTPPSLRFGAHLGLGEALLAENRLRDAALHLARAAALDFVDADRVARATVKLAECASKLPDGDAKTQACTRARAVLAGYGDTPAAARARTLLKELGC